MLELEGVHAYYGEHHVLQGVSLTAMPARVTALLGRNGAGKTTCLHSIMGFVPPRAGTIRFMGTSLRDLAPYKIARRGLALVPQGKRLFPSLTVGENLTMAARPGHWTLRRVFDLFPVLERRAGLRSPLLSGGEQQMLIIGRALMTNPKLILLDEPSEGLAPVIVRELADIITNLAKEADLAIVLVEQNLGMALAVADEICVLSMGQVVYRGSATDFSRDEEAQSTYLGVAA